MSLDFSLSSLSLNTPKVTNVKFDPVKCVALLQKAEYINAEKYLHEFKGETSSEYWDCLGLALRGQSRLNEANAAFERSTKSPNPTSKSFYNLGRLHGEAVSFHRSEDIKKSKYNSTILSSPENIVYSCFGEQLVIKRLIDEIGEGNLNKFAVDIGASDGLTFSNTYSLYEAGWDGACVEVRKNQFAQLSQSYEKLPQTISLFNNFITPDNVVSFFELTNVPKDFGFLSLDIDSYDYFVLEKIFQAGYFPSVICSEINELCIPPMRFSIGYPMGSKPGMIGQSICLLNDLITKYNYSLVHLEYNNAFVVRNDLVVKLKTFSVQTSEEAYNKGFLHSSDWELKLMWNKGNVHQLLQMTEQQRLDTFKNLLGDSKCILH